MSEIQTSLKAFNATEYINKLCENKDHWIANYLRITGYNIEDLELVEQRKNSLETCFQLRRKDQSVNDAMVNHEYLKIQSDLTAAQAEIARLQSALDVAVEGLEKCDYGAFKETVRLTLDKIKQIKNSTQ